MNFDLLFVLLFYFSGLLGGVSLGYMLAGKWASPFVKPERSEANNLPASTPPPMPKRKTVEPYRPVVLRYQAGRPVNRESLIRELQSRPNEKIYLQETRQAINDAFDRAAEQAYQRKAAEEAFGIAAGMEAFRDFFNTGNWPKPGVKRSFPGEQSGANFGNQSTAPEGYNG